MCACFLEEDSASEDGCVKRMIIARGFLLGDKERDAYMRMRLIVLARMWQRAKSAF